MVIVPAPRRNEPDRRSSAIAPSTASRLKPRWRKKAPLDLCGGGPSRRQREIERGPLARDRGPDDERQLADREARPVGDHEPPLPAVLPHDAVRPEDQGGAAAPRVGDLEANGSRQA